MIDTKFKKFEEAGQIVLKFWLYGLSSGIQ